VGLVGTSSSIKRSPSSHTGLNRWFKVDDIAISYLFKIADLYGLTVKVKATQKKAQTPQDLDLG